MNCRLCSIEMNPASSAAPWRTKHGGRGLCRPCMNWAKRTGQYMDFERTYRSRDEVLDDWDLLRSEGYTKRQAAERLGMTTGAFLRAFYRARAAGDPRAVA